MDAEISLRYWASHYNLFQFALVPLRSYETYQLACVAEHELIAQWQTPLNYPRAMTTIKKTALGFRISSKKRTSMYGTFGLRLWSKLHKRTRIVAARDSLSRTPVNKPGDYSLSLDLVPEQPLKPQSFSGPGRQLMRKCMPSSSSVATLKIPIATGCKVCSRVRSSLA